jgi:beta-galactosidase
MTNSSATTQRKSGMNKNPEWESPELIERNRETTHVPWGAYETKEQARSCDRGSSRFVLSLNGTWKFRLFDNPGAAPAFHEPDFETAE